MFKKALTGISGNSETKLFYIAEEYEMTKVYAKYHLIEKVQFSVRATRLTSENFLSWVNFKSF